MAIYAIGDVHGHLAPLLHLLDIIKFNPADDQVWLAGDIVNRGPDSLEVMRFIRELGDAARTVLGNHDLHLLAMAHGVRKPKSRDTFDAILSAPDRQELLSWLRHLPIVHVDKSMQTLMVHAGIYGKWSKKELVRHGRELEGVLRGDDYTDFLENMYGNKPKQWKKTMTRWERCRFIVNVCTRMRFCSHSGKPDFKYKGPPGSQPDTLIPWFRYPKRRCTDWRIVFGHWSTLGYLRESNVISLDSGCLWGHRLTAVQLDCKKNRIRQIECD